METEIRELVLGQLMYLLSQEDKYSCKIYHYIDDMGLEPIECTSIIDVDLTQLNKLEFGLLKRINIEDITFRMMVEEEEERRKGLCKK